MSNEMTAAAADMLWLGYEDVSGLWEVSWQDDDLEEPDRTQRRTELFLALILEGYVEVAAGPPSDEFDSAPHPSVDALRALLQDSRSWQGPGSDDEGSHTIRFRTTDAGFAAYRAALGWDEGAPSGQ